MPQVSIILPVYNVEKYLPQCLDSIVNQTLKDFECICVNDGSTDNSLSILQEYANKDSRIKIISQENKGVSAARNKALKQCIGKYITFVDSDDFISENCLEQLITVAEKENTDAVWCGHTLYFQSENRYETGRNKEGIKKLLNKYSNIKSVDKKLQIALDLTEKSRNIWAKIYKRDFVEKNKVCFLENSFAEADYPFTVFMMLCLPKIGFIDNDLYCYRKQVEGITSKKKVFRKNSIKSFIYLTIELESRGLLKDNKILKNFVLCKFISNIGKKMPEEIHQEVFSVIYDHFLYLKKILKSSFINVCKINFYILVMKIFKTKSFMLFRLLKNF